MSYHLMVFEPEAAPKDHAKFMDWYFKLTKWEDGPYDDPARTTERLRAWLLDMQRTFPIMDSPEADAIDDAGADISVLTDYSIGREFIYAGFRWSKAVEAATEAERLAILHGVGFFDVSGPDEDVYLPSPEGLRLAHRKRASLGSKLRKMFGLK